MWEKHFIYEQTESGRPLGIKGDGKVEMTLPVAAPTTKVEEQGRVEEQERAQAHAKRRVGGFRSL